MRRFAAILLIAFSSISAFAEIYTITDSYYDSLTIDDNDTLIMTGGAGGIIWGRNNGVLDIKNTSSPYVYGISGIDTIRLWENSQLYFSGGSLRLLEATDNAAVVLSGGQIGEINAYYPAPGDLNHITIYCQSGWIYQDQHFSGLWLDGSSFNIRLYSQGSSSVLDNLTIIPEPASLILFAFGGVLIRRKR